MDIVLERILSLIPKKPNGDFVHGEKKIFAENIGLKSGNVIADWVRGQSSSYHNYLYEISAKYGVSVEWLRGETDVRQPAPEGDGLDEDQRALMALFDSLDPAGRAALLADARALAEARRSRDGR